MKGSTAALWVAVHLLLLADAKGSDIGDYEYWYDQLPRAHLARFGRDTDPGPPPAPPLPPEPSTALVPPSPLAKSEYRAVLEPAPGSDLIAPEPEATTAPVAPAISVSETPATTESHIQYVPAHAPPTPPPRATHIHRVPPRTTAVPTNPGTTALGAFASTAPSQELAPLPGLRPLQNVEGLEATEGPVAATEAPALPASVPASPLTGASRLRREVTSTSAPLTIEEIVSADPKLVLAAAAVAELKGQDAEEASVSLKTAVPVGTTQPQIQPLVRTDDSSKSSDDLQTSNFFWGLGPVYPHLYYYRRIPHLVPIPGWNPYRSHVAYHPYQCC